MSSISLVTTETVLHDGGQCSICHNAVQFLLGSYSLYVKTVLIRFHVAFKPGTLNKQIVKASIEKYLYATCIEL